MYPLKKGGLTSKKHKKVKKYLKKGGVYSKMIYFYKKNRSWQNYVSVH
jgi:hypothetical protein